MKKKLLAAILSSIFAILLIASPVFAWGIDLVGVHYADNPATTPAEVLWVEWIGHPSTGFTLDDLSLTHGRKTFADIEASVQTRIDDMILKKENINQYPVDDPVRANPPVLCPNQEIVGNQVYTHLCFFSIHVYSVDNPDTPQNELSFITRFSQYPIEDNWWPQ